jgi:hypothetical protein
MLSLRTSTSVVVASCREYAQPVQGTRCNMHRVRIARHDALEHVGGHKMPKAMAADPIRVATQALKGGTERLRGYLDLIWAEEPRTAVEDDVVYGTQVRARS